MTSGKIRKTSFTTKFLRTSFIASLVAEPVPVYGFVAPTNHHHHYHQHGAAIVHHTPTSHLRLLDSQVAIDLAVAIGLGFGTDPLIDMVFDKDDVSKENFKSTVLYGSAKNIAASARIYGTLILLSFFLSELPIPLPDEFDVQRFQQVTAPEIALTIWAALAFCNVKRILLKNACAAGRLGRVYLYDRLIDFVVSIVTIALVLGELSIDIGMGIQSVFAAGSLGALTFSLASKDLAENIVGGFLIQAWDAFDEGECVQLGDGTEGQIKKCGLVETEIMGYDNIVVRIPNSQLSTQRVSNLSRIKQSRVLQMLRIRYSDIGKVPKILKDVLTEVSCACPKLVTDGSKPFRALVTSYEDDHIQAEVMCHFNIPPTSSEFAENRQEVLLAIARAFETNQAEFALPSIHYKTNKGSNEASMF